MKSWNIFLLTIDCLSRFVIFSLVIFSLFNSLNIRNWFAIFLTGMVITLLCLIPVFRLNELEKK